MNITSFLLYCLIVTFTPGPTNIVILSAVQNFGVKKTMEYVYGATVSFGILLAVSALLNSALITVVPKVLSIMQIIGSFYILYLAYQIFKMDVSEATVSKPVGFITGLLMQFVNPKVILFTMTVIPSFVIPYYNSFWSLFVFAAVITAIGFLAFITWVLFGTIFKEFLQKYQRASNTIMALFLVYSAFVASGIVGLFRR
ncbi:LysE family transporter [Desulfosporosinus sp. PR]|uniref:LysE family translocator n=1 Tax=Candidatus Desulfosporosinus nitrosoreducens TaxID=3401928 RepID=UPI0027FBACFA|nr:LysE family transporter [Desulfosporosinus sp. PR]MDQ7095224.1 LysE family transporter [Desulfosporosinus sp. PR]